VASSPATIGAGAPAGGISNFNPSTWSGQFLLPISSSVRSVCLKESLVRSTAPVHRNGILLLIHSRFAISVPHYCWTHKQVCSICQVSCSCAKLENFVLGGGVELSALTNWECTGSSGK
jgi:hypothetical protein